jgi:hypothetical protein
MPEPPDFDQIAEGILSDAGVRHDVDFTVLVAEQLRLMWNARGAADLDAIDAAAAYTSPIARAVRTLDR